MRLLSTGVEGLDALLGGGIPEGHIVAVVGAYGTGKTTLGIHFIYEGLKSGENCMIISFEEEEESILENARSVGMDISKFDGLTVLRLEAVEVRKSFERVESEIAEMMRSSSVSRMFIDAISALETLYDEAGRYQVLATIRRILKSSGVTAMISSEADKYLPTASKYGILEYICDGLISLKYIRKSELDEPTLGIEVVKMRRVKHSRKPRPYAITERGIVVYEEAEIF